MKQFVSLLCAFLILVSSTTPAFAANGSTTVYITKTGECYHTGSCSYLKSKLPITLQDAIDAGYRPCSKCHPPHLDSGVSRASNTAYSSPASSGSTFFGVYAAVAGVVACLLIPFMFSNRKRKMDAVPYTSSPVNTSSQVYFEQSVQKCTSSHHLTPLEGLQYRQSCMDAAYRELFNGHQNPYTNRPILTEEDYRAYIAGYVHLHGHSPCLPQYADKINSLNRLRSQLVEHPDILQQFYDAGVTNFLHTQSGNDLPL